MCDPVWQKNGSVRGYYENIYQDGAIGDYAFPGKGFLGFSGNFNKLPDKENLYDPGF